ncbi:MAG: N-formylglutamate amidohydrolase [Candidatus Thermoplasmatota archaeon]|nr:N-formylglutamate amidohydrolase [Candidatus Thermoplasmatota archaeon]
MRLKELLVVIPHSGIIIPEEIDPGSLSEDLPYLMRNIDWYTNYLYDLRDILENRQVTFPYCSLLLEANRHPDIIDDSVPLKDVFGESIYKRRKAPNETLRKALSEKYLLPFHESITRNIAAGADFLLEAHSTITARGVNENQIDLMNFQHSSQDEGPVHFSPSIFIKTYAEELRKRLPEVEVTVNASEYHEVYGHICAQHSVNAIGRIGKRVPGIVQETNQRLYMRDDGTPDIMAIEKLRRAFAGALYQTLVKIQNQEQANKVLDLPITRQTYDFDCGAKSLQTLLAYYGIDIREDSLMKELSISKIDGSSIDSIISLAESKGFTVEAREKMTIEDIKESIDEEHPVLVLLQAWADRKLTSAQWRRNLDDGHYVLVIGYGKDKLVFEDPSTFHRTWLHNREFMDRWHDRDPRGNRIISRFGMILLGREPIGHSIVHMD